MEANMDMKPTGQLSSANKNASRPSTAEEMNLTKVSKKLSYILRHDPSSANIELSSDGFAPVSKITSALKINREILQYIVNEDNKGRYSFSKDKKFIRANQGHSVPVDLGYKTIAAPSVLYHGTSADFLDSIMSSGVNAGSRHAVHLSDNLETAWIVAERRRKPIVLAIDAEAMNVDGVEFSCSENNVWLTDKIDKKFINEVVWNKAATNSQQ